MNRAYNFYLERPFFWTEERDPECWLRGLRILLSKQGEGGFLPGSLVGLWKEYLQMVFSRRSIYGFNGLVPVPQGFCLNGVGFLQKVAGGWRIDDGLVTVLTGNSDERCLLEWFCELLLLRSPWLRLLLLRLKKRHWVLQGWQYLRSGRAGLHAAANNQIGLFQQTYAEPEQWFSELGPLCLQYWLPADGELDYVGLRPEVLRRKLRQDSFSWAALKPVLYLLDALGWLQEDGRPAIPEPLWVSCGLAAGESGLCLKNLLCEITEKEADLRGFIAIEPVMRLLYERLSEAQFVSTLSFAAWMDEFLSWALKSGKIEILAAEPGQARHGRGLFGDRQRQLVRWKIHGEIDV